MPDSLKPPKGLGLGSGGLDSILSALILRRNGVDVEWITFETPFFSSQKARRAADAHQIPLTVQNITSIYLPMLKNPPAGYGKYMNPCMDCHALMFRLAGEVMRARNFDFLFSGEVLGQRPMSQTRPSLRYVEKHSGMEGLILRPLSAQLLPETIPAQMGLIDPQALLGLCGRSRKRQMQLAQEWGVVDYPAPAGGCLLTDKGYCRRLKDYFDHQEHWREAELHLLKYGRHFRLANGNKIIIGRTLQDNQKIISWHHRDHDIILRIANYPGPIGWVDRGADSETVRYAASLCIGYCKAPQDRPIDVIVNDRQGKEIVKVTGLPVHVAKPYMI